MGLCIVILAAGNGKRMTSNLPKVLHRLGGIPLLLHVIKTAKSLQPDSIHVVYGRQYDIVKSSLSDLNVEWVEQDEPKGTGHALLQVLPKIPSNKRVLVLYGDVPLIQPATLEDLLTSSLINHLSILVAKVPDPTGLGRIIRDQEGHVTAIVEHKDANQEQLQIDEINTGIMIASGQYLNEWLPQLKNQNNQGEFYLTDIIAMAVASKVNVTACLARCNIEVSGVNNRQELILLERHYQKRLALEFLKEGVTIIDPARFDCRGDVKLAKDVQIDINVILEGEVFIDEGTYIGPNTYLKNVRIGKQVEIKSHCVIEDAKIADQCVVGPFARIRPMTELKEGVHVGNFVELKKTTIDQGSKVNHLTYLGDAIVGKEVNVGAGTITCNYDGINKSTTIIEDKAFIGSGTELVAPVVIGEGAYIGAGSTITQNAPEEQLTLSRSRQVTVKGWRKKQAKSTT